jgi:hypothetical protein
MMSDSSGTTRLSLLPSLATTDLEQWLFLNRSYEIGHNILLRLLIYI